MSSEPEPGIAEPVERRPSVEGVCDTESSRELEPYEVPEFYLQGGPGGKEHLAAYEGPVEMGGDYAPCYIEQVPDMEIAHREGHGIVGGELYSGGLSGSPGTQAAVVLYTSCP